ncbi:hypothetical protein J437_LFUL016703 [Ladona fulva]|uniref:TAFII55 protein conserved region domain-containing protein n=1 Tax=Ladona fulva TaxID=123851 RepID=A0A8K0KKH8_LADFU|nr:hypothetical protein J437_LFUL016703 [Ladona fulva]
MNRNVEPKREVEPPAELESQFILRLPPEPAKVLREVIRSGSMGLKERFSIKVENDMRYGEVRLDHWLMPAKVMDFPTILESLKTIDGKSFYKTADVCQMLICREEDDEEKGKDGPDGDGTGEAAFAKGKKKDPNKVDRKFLWPHGLTPPLKNVRKRRFRKTLKKKYVEAPEIEKEVKRLLRVDNDAVSVKWEIIANEDEADSGVGTGTMETNCTSGAMNDAMPASAEKDDGEEPESRNGNGISVNAVSRVSVAPRFKGAHSGGSTEKTDDGAAEDDIFGGAVSDSDEEGIEEEKSIVSMEGRRTHLELEDRWMEEDDEENGNTLLDDIEEGGSRISAVDSRNSDSTFGTDSLQQNTSSPLPLVTQFSKEMFSPSRGGKEDMLGPSGTESVRRDLMSSPKGKSKEMKGAPSGSPAKNVSKASLSMRICSLGRELEELSKQLQAAQEAEAAARENQALRQRFACITDSLLEQQAAKKQEYEEIQLLLQSP